MIKDTNIKKKIIAKINGGIVIKISFSKSKSFLNEQTYQHKHQIKTYI